MTLPALADSAPGVWHDFLTVGSVAELALSCRALAATAMSEARLGASWLIIRDPQNRPPCWVLQPASLRRSHVTLECPLVELSSPSPARTAWVTPVPPDQLLYAWARPTAEEPEYLPAQTIIVPLGDDIYGSGAWLIGLKGSEAVPTEILETISEIGQYVAALQQRILQADRLEHANSQLRQFIRLMEEALRADDEVELINACLQAALRQLGFDRICWAQFDAEHNRLQTALHSGFGTYAPPPALARESEQYLLNALTHGRVLIEERHFSPGWPNFGQSLPLRRVAVPIMSGQRRLGLLYAEQLEFAGPPLHVDVLEAFGRQAGVALENLRLRLHAERRAETDPLTGLHNRAYLDRLLELEIPRVRRYNHPISLLMLDLFDFKRVNDTWGHPFGDAMLRETAQILKSNVRRPDVAIRYGGDEFVIVMVNTSPEQAEAVKRRIEHAFIERNRLQEDESRMIHISIGLRSADAQTLGDLLFDADQAMYAQKARQKRDKLVEALIAAAPDKIEAADRVVGNLCMMLYKKAPFYAGHARRVAAVSVLLAQRVGLSGDELQTLVLAALLHGIGKVSLPAELLMKPGPLTPSERAALRGHVQIGDEFFEGLDHLEPVRPILIAHHERFDGELTDEEFPAYPHGLSGERIPLSARILKLAEAVDAISTDRPWATGRSPEETARILLAESGRSFDPRLVGILLSGNEWQEAIRDPLFYLQHHLANVQRQPGATVGPETP